MAPAPQGLADEAPPHGRARTAYTMILICIIAIANYGDRSLFGVLMQPMKVDLHIDDSTLGSFAFLFALAYTLAAFPIARVADRGDRIRLLAICLSIWSLFTVATSLTRNIIQLLLIRIGVACAESGGHPATQSLVVDLFAQRRRASMLSVYAASGPIGASIGLAAGGLIASLYGWRAAFLIVGLPGLVLAPLVFLFGYEPRRAGLKSEAAPRPQVVPLRTFIPLLYKEPLIRLVLLIVGSVAFAAGGVAGWSAPFFMRIHHMPLREVGAWLGAATILGGVGGLMLSGFISDRLARRDLRWYPRIAALGVFLGLPAAVFYLIAPTASLAIGWMLAHQFMSSFWLGPIYALMLSWIDPGIRALLSATIAALVNVTAGLGGFCVGLLSDRLHPLLGDDALRFAMLAAVSPAAIAGVGCLLLIRLAGSAPAAARA